VKSWLDTGRRRPRKIIDEKQNMMNPHAAIQIVIQDDKNKTKNYHDLYRMSQCRSEDSIREKTAPNIPVLERTDYYVCKFILYYPQLDTQPLTADYGKQCGIESKN
jgi:hypothetical protein